MTLIVLSGGTLRGSTVGEGDRVLDEAAAVVLDASVDGAGILVGAGLYVGFVTVGPYVVAVGEVGRV